ncbi:MAG: orotate phosphoribosyltransferase [Methanobacterium sp.]
MEIRGICSICGRPGKMYTCTLCGSIVCGNCYNIQKGVCRSCERFKGLDTIKSLK